jgi:MFS family permease
VALLCIREKEIAPASDAAHGRKSDLRAQLGNVAGLLRRRPVVIFAIAVMLFHLANAAMLPLAASLVTLRSNQMATILVAAAIVVPQFTVTLLSPIVGRLAESWGRRPLLLLGFGALALRGVLFALYADPRALAAIQLLDGLSAAALGVLGPLTVADLTRECGHFNLAQGVIGCAMGFGASLSTTLSGYLTDSYGGAAAFDLLAAIAVVSFVFVAFAMPETRPDASPP